MYSYSSYHNTITESLKTLKFYIHNFSEPLIFLTTFNFQDQPVFFWGFSLFFLTVLSSFFSLPYLGLYGVFFLNLSSLTTFWLTLLPYIKLILSDQVVYKIYLGKWFYLNYGVRVDFNFLIDSISFSFILLTTTIGLFVYIYTFSYFRYEPLVDRFLLFLCSFILSMLFLVSSGNIVMLFLGWELIGLTSFFLINFWVTRMGTLKAAFKAFSFNKISDFFMLMLLIIFYNFLYDFDITTVNNQIHLYYNYKLTFLHFNINLVEVITFTILSAAFIKSAQIGVHVWLPDSMEAPVPASSLIHSATLVSAGIFLVLRFYPVFEYSYYSFFLIPLIGSLTAAYGGIVASYQADIKRILAYSTVSHCGFLMLLCSFNTNEFTIMYLYVHGFFKALVFMCVGNIIRISKNYQDFRRMGSFSKYLPFECFCTFLCLFNLGGLPFSIGFFIKHLISLGVDYNIWLVYLTMFNIFLGSVSGLFYSYRIIYFVFLDFKKGQKNAYRHINRNNYFSYFYSNTSLSSNTNIICLVVVAYCICFYIFLLFFKQNFLQSDLNSLYLTSNFFNLFYPCKGLLFNLSYLNWIVLIFISNFIFLIWRRVHYPHHVYENFFNINYFLILFFFNLVYIL